MMSTDTLVKLLDISRQMAETRTLDPLLDYAMGEVLQFVGAERGYLVLMNHDETLDFRVRRNSAGQEIEKPGEQISHTIFDKVIANRESIVIGDAIVDPALQTSQSIQALQLRSVMCVPLVSRGTTLGAIYVENRANKNVFNQDDLEPLEFFASQAAVCIENAVLNENLEARVATRTLELAQINEQLKQEIEMRKSAEEELQRLAITDSLTGIYNRRHFFLLANRELERARDHEQELSIILFDVDHFKRLNDTYGHLVGDQVLQSLVRSCQRTLRSRDVLARYGGEEFAVLLPRTGVRQALGIAERLRRTIEETPLDTDKGVMSLMASFGVAVFRGEPDLTIDGLLDRADQALYQAKRDGGNRVCAWPVS